MVGALVIRKWIIERKQARAEREALKLRRMKVLMEK